MTVPSLRGDQLFPAWFLYIGTTAPVRIWSGPNRMTTGASGPDTAGGSYLGLGLLVQVPSLKLPTNGAYAQHTFSLSGVTANIVALINADREELRNANVAFGRLEQNADGTPNGNLNWLWRGVCDGPVMSRNGRSSPVAYTVGIKASTGSVSRKRRLLSLYTPSQQFERDPADTSCNWVPTHADGTQVTWPLP